MDDDEMLKRARRDLDELERLFDMTGPLGPAVLNATADAILAAMEAETNADGDRWPELGPGYAAWKAEHAPGQPMAVLDGIMRQPDELRGEREVRPDRASMTYGLREEARAHAAFFQEGGGPVKARPFYYLGRAVLPKAEEVLVDHFRSFTVTT